MTAVRNSARTLDAKKYGRLLSRAVPTVIESEGEWRRANTLVTSLMRKEDRSAEETELLKLIASLIQAYEARRRSEQTRRKLTVCATADPILKDLTERSFDLPDLLN